MRCTIFVLSLAIIYATASPISDIVPEDSLYSLDDDLSEAQTKIDEMTAEGKSDKDCRKLVTDTRTEIKTNVGTCQKVVDALPRGDHCTNLGQSQVEMTTEAKAKADKLVAHCDTQVKKAASASVVFGSRTYSSLTVGSCSTFYSSTAYTTAKATHKSAMTAHAKAKGAAAEAATALKNAIAAAAKEKHDCLCKTRSDHATAFAKHSASDAERANQETWDFANKLECVLDGKANCPQVLAPKCKRPKVTSAVMEETCVTKKKPQPKTHIVGTWAQKYTNGHKDSTTATCKAMRYRANRINLTGNNYLIPANSGYGMNGKKNGQNSNSKFPASAGWYWRPWDRSKAWEFFKIQSDGTLVVRHFCTDSTQCSKISPEGSPNYCCSSTSRVTKQSTCQAT